jgi:hypothetical protein
MERARGRQGERAHRHAQRDGGDVAAIRAHDDLPGVLARRDAVVRLQREPELPDRPCRDGDGVAGGVGLGVGQRQRDGRTLRGVGPRRLPDTDPRGARAARQTVDGELDSQRHDAGIRDVDREGTCLPPHEDDACRLVRTIGGGVGGEIGQGVVGRRGNPRAKHGRAARAPELRLHGEQPLVLSRERQQGAEPTRIARRIEDGRGGGRALQPLEKTRREGGIRRRADEGLEPCAIGTQAPSDALLDQQVRDVRDRLRGGRLRGMRIAAVHLDLVRKEVLAARDDDEANPTPVCSPGVGRVAMRGIALGGRRAGFTLRDEVADPGPARAVGADQHDDGVRELDLRRAGGGAEGRARDRDIATEVHVDHDRILSRPADGAELLPQPSAGALAIGELLRVGVVVRPRIVGRG